MVTSSSIEEKEIHWPKRAIITAGMPYGNKELHFGHLGGVFIPADCFARFLRDRIGKDNVIFVSGTDCYGSPIVEGYRKAIENNTFNGTIEEYIYKNHAKQKEILEKFNISLNIFEGSNIGHAGEVHKIVSDQFVKRLFQNSFLHLESNYQFYDPEAEIFLNGRQVEGFCPVQGCKSEKGYADECDLGHQYEPKDLLSPKSTITGTIPIMRKVSNWYFDLPKLAYIVKDYEKSLENDPQSRPLVYQVIKEFLAPPIIYIKDEFLDQYRDMEEVLPPHIYHKSEKGKKSFALEFENISQRDIAKTQLREAHIRYRTGKTLVPLRISGNIEWGIPVPEMKNITNLTLWCWPESLWAPISFTIAYIDSLGLPRSDWRKFWCDKNSCVYQFIGQDNLYFYGVAQPALFSAMQDKKPVVMDPEEGELQQTKIVANHHILFGDKKASSSSLLQPPSIDDLLDHYSVEQLRAHFLALALDQKAVSFKPKVFDSDNKKKNDPRASDPVLKEGAMLNKVFNRIARSCLYEANKQFSGYIPLGSVTKEVLSYTTETMNLYEKTMYKIDLHSIVTQMDVFLRSINKYWSKNIQDIKTNNDLSKRRQNLLDTSFMLRIALLLMHPIAPSGTEKICHYLNFNFDEFFSWNYDFESMDELCSANEVLDKKHKVLDLPPHTDFFPFHPSQIKKNI